MGLAKRTGCASEPAENTTELVDASPSLGLVVARRHGRRCHGIRAGYRARDPQSSPQAGNGGVQEPRSIALSVLARIAGVLVSVSRNNLLHKGALENLYQMRPGNMIRREGFLPGPPLGPLGRRNRSPFQIWAKLPRWGRWSEEAPRPRCHLTLGAELMVH